MAYKLTRVTEVQGWHVEIVEDGFIGVDFFITDRTISDGVTGFRAKTLYADVSSVLKKHNVLHLVEDLDRVYDELFQADKQQRLL